MKKCSKCKSTKPVDNFNKNRSRRDGLHHSCKECKRKDQKNWYLLHKQAQIDRTKKRKIEVRDLIREIKESSSCVDCGQKYPYYVMDFDHLPGSIKKFNIGSYTRSGGINLLKKEIEKCEIVCSNCHRERTHGRVANIGLATGS